MTQKKAAASPRIRGRKPRKKTSGKLRKPTPRQVKLVKGIVEGKSVRQSALAAGYSSSMAEHAGALLSTEAMRGFMQRRFSLEKICQRIDEGMDAELSNTVVLGRKGKETVQINTFPHHSERRQAAALAAKLIGADPASKIEVQGDVTTLVRIEFIDVAATPS